LIRVIVTLLPAAILAIAQNGTTVALSSASISINPQSTDSYAIQGSFNNLNFGTAQSVTWSVGPFSGTIPWTSFVQQQGTNVFFYQDAAGLLPYWVSRVALDLDAQSFAVQASGTVLAGLPNPFVVQLGTDLGAGCVMARVSQTETGAYQLSSGDGVGEPCVASVPVTDPPRVVLGSPTTVTVSAALESSVDNIAVFRADGNGQPTGDPLCTLPAGGSGGLFSCSFTANETSAGEIPMLLQGAAGLAANGRKRMQLKAWMTTYANEVKCLPGIKAVDRRPKAILLIESWFDCFELRSAGQATNDDGPAHKIQGVFASSSSVFTSGPSFKKSA
jgi:hypothetical protein